MPKQPMTGPEMFYKVVKTITEAALLAFIIYLAYRSCNPQ